MSNDIRVRYAPVQRDIYILGMQEQHYLIIYLPEIKMVNLLFRIEDTDQKAKY